MEELQSTEVLDREILEDARRKAFRILKTADDTVKSNTAGWEKKTAAALEDLNTRHEERRRRTAEEIMARFPLDQRRAESEKIEALLSRALDLWYAAQSRQGILTMLEGELRRRLEDYPEFGSRPFRVTFHKLEKGEGEGLLKQTIPEGKWEINTSGLDAGGAAGASSTGAGAAIKASGVLLSKYPELVLDSPQARISVSLSLLIEELLSDYRAELTCALIGDQAAEQFAGVSPGGLS
jgi:glutamate formiminotransferase